MRSFIIMTAMLFAIAGCSRTTLRDNAPDAKLNEDAGSKSALVLSVDPSLGSSLSRKEKSALSKAESDALAFAKQGEAIVWQGRTPRTRGTVSVSSPFRVGKSVCRRIIHELVLSSSPKTVDLTACKRPQSDWKLVK